MGMIKLFLGQEGLNDVRLSSTSADEEARLFLLYRELKPHIQQLDKKCRSIAKGIWAQGADQHSPLKQSERRWEEKYNSSKSEVAASNVHQHKTSQINWRNRDDNSNRNHALGSGPRDDHRQR